MPDQPIKHGHQHGPNGPDPVPFPAGGDLPRARVWATYAITPYTISSSSAHVAAMNHGYTTDAGTFAIITSGAVVSVVPNILVGGVYAITYRFIADAKGDSTAWEATRVNVDLQDVAPDYWDSFHTVQRRGDAAVQTFVTTIVDDASYLPTSVYATLKCPAGSPSLTYGRSDYNTTHPTWNTGSYIEVVRLGGVADTQDWLDWWSDTPADVALPDTLAAAELELAGPRVRGRVRDDT